MEKDIQQKKCSFSFEDIPLKELKILNLDEDEVSKCRNNMPYDSVIIGSFEHDDLLFARAGDNWRERKFSKDLDNFIKDYLENKETMLYSSTVAHIFLRKSIELIKKHKKECNELFNDIVSFGEKNGEKNGEIPIKCPNCKSANIEPAIKHDKYRHLDHGGQYLNVCECRECKCIFDTTTNKIFDKIN